MIIFSFSSHSLTSHITPPAITHFYAFNAARLDRFVCRRRHRVRQKIIISTPLPCSLSLSLAHNHISGTEEPIHIIGIAATGNGDAAKLSLVWGACACASFKLSLSLPALSLALSLSLAQNHISGTEEPIHIIGIAA